MNFDNFTIKAQQALQQALQRAASGGQQALEPVHLLAGVLAVGENVTHFLFSKLGVNEKMITAAVDRQLASLPRVSGGGEPYLSRESNEVMTKGPNRRATSLWDWKCCCVPCWPYPLPPLPF